METTKEREQNSSQLGSAERESVRHSQTTNKNIRQLLEMLNNPDAYTEQEIHDIINRDEDTRETYRLMVEAKRSSRHRQNRKPVDVDAAWQRFNQRLRVGDGYREALATDRDARTSGMELQPRQQRYGWMKIAASFIGVLLVSGIAFATIHIVRQHQRTEAPNAEVTESMTSSVTTAPADTLASDTVIVQPVIYDDIPLEKMLPEIAAHYDVKVAFANEEARQLRFRFVWNPQQGIDQVISDLSQFEHLTITRKDNQITVK